MRHIHEFSYHCAVKHNHQLLSDGFSYHDEDVNADGTVENNVIVYSEAGDDYINLIVVDVNNYMHS